METRINQIWQHRFVDALGIKQEIITKIVSISSIMVMGIPSRMVMCLILNSTFQSYIKGNFHTFYLPLKENNWQLVQEPGLICSNCNNYYPNLSLKTIDCFGLYCWECQVG